MYAAERLHRLCEKPVAASRRSHNQIVCHHTHSPLTHLQKSSAPALSESKRDKQIKPLDFLVQRAAVDGSTRWRRVYQLGSKAELLAVVKQPGGEGGPVTVGDRALACSARLQLRGCIACCQTCRPACWRARSQPTSLQTAVCSNIVDHPGVADDRRGGRRRAALGRDAGR